MLDHLAGFTLSSEDGAAHHEGRAVLPTNIPSYPSFLLSDLSMQLLVRLVLEEAFSRAFILFVILLETN